MFQSLLLVITGLLGARQQAKYFLSTILLTLRNNPGWGVYMYPSQPHSLAKITEMLRG